MMGSSGKPKGSSAADLAAIAHVVRDEGKYGARLEELAAREASLSEAITKHEEVKAAAESALNRLSATEANLAVMLRSVVNREAALAAEQRTFEAEREQKQGEIDRQAQAILRDQRALAAGRQTLNNERTSLNAQREEDERWVAEQKAMIGDMKAEAQRAKDEAERLEREARTRLQRAQAAMGKPA